MSIEQVLAEVRSLLQEAKDYEQHIEEEIDYDFTVFEGTAAEVAAELDGARDALQGTTDVLARAETLRNALEQLRSQIDDIEALLDDVEYAVGSGPDEARRVIAELLALNPVA